MKLRNLVLTATLLLFACSKITAQVIITKSDSIPFDNDSIVQFVLPEVRGNIQWQKSLDSKNWSNMEIETKDTLLVKSNVEALYRAVVTDGTCIPTFSDSVGIVTSDSISKIYVNTSSLGLNLISDSTDISSGKYIYTGNRNSTDLVIGKVIIDEQSGGTIRKITEIIQSGDTVSLITEQATMEDLFFNTSFKLSTEMIYPSQNLKSASMAEIEKALTDKDGFIHPLKVITKSTDGKILKSASALSNNSNFKEGSLYLHLGLTDFNFWNFTGSFTAPDPSGLNLTYSGNTKAGIKELSFTFDPIFKFEADFDLPGINWKNFSINKGELRMFKYYSDMSLLNVKKIYFAESNVAYKISKVFTFNPNYIYSLEFSVSGVPVWIDFVIELKSAISASFGEGTYSVTKGFNTNYFITAGASYENKSWSLIKGIEKEQDVYSFSNNTQNTEFRISIYPEVSMLLYGIIGPKLKVGPYLQSKTTSSANENWDDSIILGAEASVGVTADILGKEIFSLSATPWNFYSNVLFNTPHKLKLISGNNQTGKTGEQLSERISVRVENSKGENVENVQVYFIPEKGTVEESIVKTDLDGLAKTFWTLSENSGEHSLKILVKDGKDQEIEGCTLTVNATATSSFKPSVTTNTATNVTENSVTLNGNVTSDGGVTIIQRGFYWSSTDQTPDSEDNIETVSGTTGSFNKTITGLQINTKYYFRAFATNSQGTSTGNVLSFTTNQSLSIPTITTNSVTDITQTTATSGGNVTSDGGSTVTSRGVCWSTLENPTFSNSKTSNGSGTGSFTSNLTGLAAGKRYYARAYATNSEGTAYGNEISFTTNAEDNLIGTFTDARDGHLYKWVKIGEQVWMAENLAYLPQVSPPMDESYTEPYYYVYGYNGTSISEAKATDNYPTYGVLYNWPAAISSCPSGWHLPTDDEWKEMEMAIGMPKSEADDVDARGTLEGSKLKATSGWNDNGNGSDDYGFSGLPGGYRNHLGNIYDIGYFGRWWSSSAYSTTNSWIRILYNGTSYINRNYDPKEEGYSVRCIKD